MASNPALLRAVANPAPYMGAPSNPPAPAPNAAAKATPDAGADQPAHPLAELHDRTQAIRDQGTELTKNLGYLTSDASIHDDVPARVETKLGKAQDALATAMKLIDAVCDDLDSMIEDDNAAGDDAAESDK